MKPPDGGPNRVPPMMARDASAATFGGVAAGVIVGLLARADMRLVALVRQQEPHLSLFGTFGVLFTFVLMALALATASMFTRRDRPSVGGRARAARWSIAGLGLLTAVVLVTPLRQELAAPAELLLFVPVALLLGAAPVWLTEAVQGALPAARTTAARLGYRLLAAPAIIASLLIVVGVLQLSGVIPVPTE